MDKTANLHKINSNHALLEYKSDADNRSAFGEWRAKGGQWSVLAVPLYPVYTIQPSDGFDNRFDNRSVERTATVRSTGCQTGLYNRFDNRLYTRYRRLSNRLSNLLNVCIHDATVVNTNRFENKLYRVNGASYRNDQGSIWRRGLTSTGKIATLHAVNSIQKHSRVVIWRFDLRIRPWHQKFHKSNPIFQVWLIQFACFVQQREHWTHATGEEYRAKCSTFSALLAVPYV